MNEMVAWISGALAAGFIAGGLAYRSTFRSGMSELERYLHSWGDEPRESEEPGPPRQRRAFRAVFSQLEVHHQAFLSLRSLSAATTHRLRNLIDVLSEEVLIYDLEGKLLFASARIAGLAVPTEGEGEAVGDEAGEEARLAQVAEALGTSSDLGDLVGPWLAGELAPEPREVALRAGGEVRRFFATPHLIRSPSAARESTSSGLLVLLTDLEVVEEVRGNAARRVALDHIRLASELLAHRVRNPLHSIVLVAEVIRRECAGVGGEQLEKNLGTIQAEVGRLEETLERYLSMLRRREPRMESVDLVSVIETVSELLYPLAREGGVDVRQELHASSAPTRGDGVEITRALLGPALAAVRAAPRGGELKLRLDSAPREHVVSLDAGGLSPRAIELAVAEELTARNGGSLVIDDPQRPSRLTYRYRAASRNG